MASDEARGHLLLPWVATLLCHVADEAHGHPLLPRVTVGLSFDLLLPCQVAADVKSILLK
jgi:hypothetical protein